MHKQFIAHKQLTA